MLDLLGPGYYVWKRAPFGRRKCKAHLASHFELLSYFNKIPLIIARLVFVQKTFSMDLISERDVVGVKGKGLMFDRIYVSNILGFTFGSNVAYEKFRYIHGLPRDKLSKTNWGEHLEVVISSFKVFISLLYRRMVLYSWVGGVYYRREFYVWDLGGLSCLFLARQFVFSGRESHHRNFTVYKYSKFICKQIYTVLHYFNEQFTRKRRNKTSQDYISQNSNNRPLELVLAFSSILLEIQKLS